jgi:hypothetical protein
LRQIRIVKDTHAHDKPNKKSKAHRGYAFVVFEREKDMRGNIHPIFFPLWQAPASVIPDLKVITVDTYGRCGPQACPTPKVSYETQGALKLARLLLYHVFMLCDMQMQTFPQW